MTNRLATRGNHASSNGTVPSKAGACVSRGREGLMIASPLSASMTTARAQNSRDSVARGARQEETTPASRRPQPTTRATCRHVSTPRVHACHSHGHKSHTPHHRWLVPLFVRAERADEEACVRRVVARVQTRACGRASPPPSLSLPPLARHWPSWRPMFVLRCIAERRAMSRGALERRGTQHTRGGHGGGGHFSFSHGGLLCHRPERRSRVSSSSLASARSRAATTIQSRVAERTTAMRAPGTWMACAPTSQCSRGSTPVTSKNRHVRPQERPRR